MTKPGSRQHDEDPKVAVVMPCYKSRRHCLGVLAAIPAEVAVIYCVDDGCPEHTGAHIIAHCGDPRVQVLTHDANQGVGGATITGYRQALADGATIVVKLDSDGQMDPAAIPQLIAPILDGRADYTKGNRFYSPASLEGMPAVRVFGNAVLSFLNKFSSGYWHIFDPTNGYTAIHGSVLALLPLDRIARGYFFESDMLFRLGTLRAVVWDIPQKSIYGDETSNLRILSVVGRFAVSHLRNSLKRIGYNYFLRDFHAASLEWILGPPLLLFGLVFGLVNWIENAMGGTATPFSTVMLAVLTFIVGLQLTLSALHFDIQNQPRTPLQGLLGRADRDGPS